MKVVFREENGAIVIGVTTQLSAAQRLGEQQAIFKSTRFSIIMINDTESHQGVFAFEKFNGAGVVKMRDISQRTHFSLIQSKGKFLVVNS